jgi:3-dehydroquinate dehydratase-2
MDGDFDHPLLPDWKDRRHVLYRIDREQHDKRGHDRAVSLITLFTDPTSTCSVSATAHLRHLDARRLRRAHDGCRCGVRSRGLGVQSNHEGALVDAIHAARGTAAAIIINQGAFTHYAWSIHDALAAFSGPIVEGHISNPNAREPWRHTSVIAPVSTGSIMGFGMQGYRLAVEAVAAKLSAP